MISQLISLIRFQIQLNRLELTEKEEEIEPIQERKMLKLSDTQLQVISNTHKEQEVAEVDGEEEAEEAKTTTKEVVEVVAAVATVDTEVAEEAIAVDMAAEVLLAKTDKMEDTMAVEVVTNRMITTNRSLIKEATTLEEDPEGDTRKEVDINRKINNDNEKYIVCTTLAIL
jgi:DNA polymerase sigma